MGLISRLLGRPGGAAQQAEKRAETSSLPLLRRRSRHSGRRTGQGVEGVLRARLAKDPNDAQAFSALAEIIRREAAEGHEDGERHPRGVADAEWALAEELAQSPRAWYPLIELGRLSLNQDPEGAQRRLVLAAQRESTGRGLAEVLAMLRREGMPELALSLGVGHWRPRDHVPGAGRELVRAAAEAGRISEARRHLDALAQHPDADVVDLRDQLDGLARGT